MGDYNGTMGDYNGTMDHYNGTMDHYTMVQWIIIKVYIITVV